MAQYDDPTVNYLQTFCNATDAAGEGTYILDRIMAGYRSVAETNCITLFDMGFNNKSGWDWQVYNRISVLKHVAFRGVYMCNYACLFSF